MYGQKVNRWVKFIGSNDQLTVWNSYTVDKVYQLEYNDNVSGSSNIIPVLGVRDDSKRGWVNYNAYKKYFKEVTFDKYFKQAIQC